MAEYTIRDLENFTNIKAHTIRIWEQRFQILEPQRNATNVRLYSDDDLRKIMNVNLLYMSGFKISRIAKMSGDEILNAAKAMLLQTTESEQLIGQFVHMIIAIDRKGIEQLLTELLKEQGMETLYGKTIIPLLKRIGDLWQVHSISVSHEHFFSNILRDFFVVETSKLPHPEVPKQKAVLFLHEFERHEFPLLFFSFLLRREGYTVFYLGPQVPLDDLQRFTSDLKPDFLVTCFISEFREEAMKLWFGEIAAFFPLDRIHVGGIQSEHYDAIIPPQIVRIGPEWITKLPEAG